MLWYNRLYDEAAEVCLSACCSKWSVPCLPGLSGATGSMRVGRFGITLWLLTCQPCKKRRWHGHNHKHRFKQQHNHAFTMSWRWWRWRNQCKNSVSITGYGRCHFFSVISPKSQVETTYFSAGTRSARQRDNMSSDPVLMNSRWSVSASKVWNCPGRGIGTKLDFKQTSPLHTPWKRSKGKLHAKETDLRKPMRMKSCWCLLLLEERRDGQDHRAGQLWALDMGPSGCLAWTLWHQGSQSSSHKWFLPWSKHGTKWLSAFPASPAIQSFF